MTLKTIIWFTCGGSFAALYANKAQGLHFLFKPRRILLTTILGFAVGYKVSNFEDNMPQLLAQAAQEHPFSAHRSRESLLTYQAMVRRNQEQVAEGDFEVSEEEEEEEEDDE